MTEPVPYHVAQQELEAAARVAHETEQRIRRNVHAMRRMWVGLAEDLYSFHELDMWRDLGHSSFEAWMASPEVDFLERRSIYDLIAAWRELVVNRGVEVRRLESVNVSKVREVLPAIRREVVTVDDALSDCEALTRNDLQMRYRGLATQALKAGAVRDALDAELEPQFAICGYCGSRYEIQSIGGAS